VGFAVMRKLYLREILPSGDTQSSSWTRLMFTVTTPPNFSSSINLKNCSSSKCSQMKKEITKVKEGGAIWCFLAVLAAAGVCKTYTLEPATEKLLPLFCSRRRPKFCQPSPQW